MVINDHSLAEVLADEMAVAAASVLIRAVEWFAAWGIIVERVLSDNGGA